MCNKSGSIAGRHEHKFMSDHTGRREPSGELPSLLQTCLKCLKPLKNTEKCVKGQIDQVRRWWSHCSDFKSCECSDDHSRPTFTNDASSYQTPMSLGVKGLGSGFQAEICTQQLWLAAISPPWSCLITLLDKIVVHTLISKINVKTIISEIFFSL